MANRIQFRRDTAANWATYDPVLADGEIGIERDTQRFKLGDGVSKWSALPYSSTTLKSDPEQFLALIDVVDTAYDVNGLVTAETYANGAKKLYTYTAGYLTKEEFTDTDGVTVVLTITYGYDANNNLISRTRA